jgi:hypothetical protein
MGGTERLVKGARERARVHVSSGHEVNRFHGILAHGTKINKYPIEFELYQTYQYSLLT